jgi:hypothetical protein
VSSQDENTFFLPENADARQHRKEVVMPQQLPLIPNIEHLRKQAKDFLRLCRAGDATAVNQLRSTLTEYCHSSPAEIIKSICLSELDALHKNHLDRRLHEYAACPYLQSTDQNKQVREVSLDDAAKQVSRTGEVLQQMKLIPPMITALLLYSVGSVAADLPSHAHAKHSALKSHHHHSEASQLVWVASVRLPSGERSASLALRRAGLGGGGAASLGMGVKVKRKDAARAKRVLAADAALHHYKVTFYAVK